MIFYFFQSIALPVVFLCGLMFCVIVINKQKICDVDVFQTFFL